MMTTCKRVTVLSLALIAWGLVPATARAQSMVEDTKSRTTFILPGQAGIVGLNTADASAEIFVSGLTSRKRYFYEALVRGKMDEGAASLFGSDKLSPGVTVAAAYGYKLTDPDAKPKPTTQFSVAARLEHTWTNTATIDTAATPLPRLSKNTIDTWAYGFHLNAKISQVRLPSLAAVTIGQRLTTNYDDLAKRTMRTQRTTTNATGTSVIIEESKDGRVGAIKVEKVTYADADWMFVPFDQWPASVRLFGRGLFDRQSLSAQRQSLGFDIGFHKEGGDALFDRVAAVVIEFSETRPGDASTALRGRTKIGVVTNLSALLSNLLK